MSDQPTDPPPSGQPGQGHHPQQGAHAQPEPGRSYPQQGSGQHAGYPHEPGYPPPAQSYPPQGGYPPQQPGQRGYPSQPPMGYAPPPRPSPLGGLTDLRFTRRITPGLATMVYLAVAVLAGLTLIVGVIAAIGAFAMADDPFIGTGAWVLYGIFLLVATPLTVFVWLAFARFLLEYFLDRASETPRHG